MMKINSVIAKLDRPGKKQLASGSEKPAELTVNPHLIVGHTHDREQRDHEHGIDGAEKTLCVVKRVIDGEQHDQSIDHRLKGRRQRLAPLQQRPLRMKPVQAASAHYPRCHPASTVIPRRDSIAS